MPGVTPPCRKRGGQSSKSRPFTAGTQSFDGRTISGFLYRPSASFTGKRPVIIDIHGGPIDQYRPGFGYDDNFFINELGIARIYPNVRGSSGFGKTFLNLDDGLKREDATKDIGALLDWIIAIFRCLRPDSRSGETSLGCLFW